jgi:hypothetical protein
MGEAKQILYRYNDDTRKDEVELDQDGDSEILTGSVLDRGGRAWLVSDTVLTLSKSPTELPVLTVFLTDKFRVPLR